MRSLLQKVRLGEWLALAWLAAAAVLFTIAGRWEVRLEGSGRRYSPFVLAVLVVIAVSLLRMVFVSARQLAAAVSLARSPVPDPAMIEASASFTEETRLLRGILRFVRDGAPLLVILFVYPTSDLLIDSLQGSRLIDASLIEIDEAIFRGHASVWMERFITPLRTDVLYFCYSFHLTCTPLILLVLGLRAARRIFLEAVDGFVLLSLVGMSLYILFPAVGPVHSLAHLYTRELGGGTLSQASHALIEATRAPRDAFPSLHVGLSALMLAYAWRGSRLLGALVLAPIVGNWIGTVYLRYHYLIDVVAGLLLAIAVHEAIRLVHRRAAGPPSIEAH